MKAVQRMTNAWRRFFIRGTRVAGRNRNWHTVIFHPADSARCVSCRERATAGRPWARGPSRQM